MAKWKWLFAGVISYIILGQISRYIPNPMLPDAVLALNIVVPVIIGYFCGPVMGARVGLIGTALNFGLKIPFWGWDYFEAVSIIPHGVMGAAAGWVGIKGNRIGTAATVQLGHELNIVFFILSGLISFNTISSSVFWTGLLAEAALDGILIMLVIDIIQRIQTKGSAIFTKQRNWHGLFKSGVVVAILTSFFLGAYIVGISLAVYLLIIPIAIAALTMGTLEAWFTALVISGLLIVTQFESNLSPTEHEFSLILTFNLAALILGELAYTALKQKRIAEERSTELQQAYTLLAEDDKLKTNMIQNISHELRTPLAILLGYAKLIVDGDMGELPPEQQEMVENIWFQGKQISDLIEQITVLYEVTQKNLLWQPFTLDSLVSNQINLLQTWATTQHCSINFQSQEEMPIVYGDFKCLGIAIKALLHNAIKFSPNGGKITVKLWTENQQIFFSIQDQGVGIAKEKQDKLFERFYQVDGSTTRRFGGMGMGLAVVKGVIQAHKGDIWLNSESNEGSTFSFWLPMSDAEIDKPESLEMENSNL